MTTRDEGAWETIAKYATAIIISILLFHYYDLVALPLLLPIAAYFNAQVILIWTGAATLVIASLLCLILALTALLPLQFFPAYKPRTKTARRMALVVTAAVVTAILWHTLLSRLSALWSVPLFAVILIAAVALSIAGNFLRDLLTDLFLPNLILPSLSAKKMVIMAGRTRMTAGDALVTLRDRLFFSPGGGNGVGGSGSGAGGDSGMGGGCVRWRNAVVSGDDARIDCAYLEHPAQAALPPQDRKWVLWFPGNGELYEFLIPDLQAMCARTGVSVMAFNYRGAGSSTGKLHGSDDLVRDGHMCMNYIIETLGGRAENILLFGHSLGGGVAALLRAETSPHGPVVSERSFRNITSAAQSVFCIVQQSMLGTKINLPYYVMLGLLNAIFKGRMDVVGAWAKISGPKLVIYSEEDHMIPYETSSLYVALKGSGRLAGTDTLRLSTPPRVTDVHNLPLHRFAEFPQILERIRGLLGLSTALPEPHPDFRTLPNLFEPS